MSNFEDTSLYSKGLEYYKKNQLDNSLSFLNKIKKNLNTIMINFYLTKNILIILNKNVYC